MPSSAADTYAQVTRDQWQQYVSQFVPIENQLINYATDTQLPAENMQRAITGVQNAFQTQQGQTQRRLSGYGISLNPQEQAAATREQNLSQSLGEVGAANAARDFTVNRQRGILGAPNQQVAPPQGVV
jgi:hypothetical protein